MSDALRKRFEERKAKVRSLIASTVPDVLPSSSASTPDSAAKNKTGKPSVSDVQILDKRQKCFSYLSTLFSFVQFVRNV